MTTGVQTVQRFSDILESPPPDAALPLSLVLVGAGKMGGALLDGWLKSGLDPVRVTIIDPHPSADIVRIAAERGIGLNPASGDIGAPEVLVLAVKPQFLDEIAPDLARLAAPGTLVLSILAGKTLDNLSQRLPGTRAIVRAMPNLPASIGRGITGVVAASGTSEAQRATATVLLSGAGAVEWLDDESLIDALTGVSGSGPAYVFYLVEALAEAGVAAGLPAALSQRLARATVTGAGALLDQSPLSAAELREAVTSKGGTTAAALAVLSGENGIGPIVTQAVAAARRRAGELSG
ncbi:pyrroline-5-carboxylate reductase [Pseudochelatococcus lubricantis]|uniref:Pyrroline-5-carboxylate reductase n=1 Tax=Pseudochelatococcus lubricantis TaxID=1538102 RepID=A0ABX0V0C5_9HYPH|nr:pyrroline-5-carboxylate reductase [Pseudochelatococcus lubricantis]NIJ58627.1 pyrroline-5-carboxylate reductase [Pseudochelatococcus lubricantis]